MPKGYAIFTETIRDQAAYDGDVEKAIPTIMASGGQPIVGERHASTDADAVIVAGFEMPSA